MDYRDWLILKLLFEKKNITKTALSLYLSQPALTNRLQQMEKEFGVEIVKRGRRGVFFTPEGEYLAECAGEALSGLEKVKENVLNMSMGVAGTLKIGVSKTMMKYKLPTLLRLFKEKYSDVKFDINIGWSRDIYGSIYNGNVHIGFVRGDYPWTGKKHLLIEENVCVVSKTKIDIKKLPDLPRIDYDTDHLLRAAIDSWWVENYSKPASVYLNVDQAETCREMVMNGFGYAIMTDMTFNGRSDLYIVNLKDKKGSPLTRRTWLYCQEDSKNINVVKAFVNFVEGIDFESI